MSFRPAADLAGGRNVRWRALEGDGLEHLTLQADADGFRADSVLIGETVRPIGSTAIPISRSAPSRSRRPMAATSS